jgi:NADH:ubiquinone oxidoreductase subunit K
LIGLSHYLIVAALLFAVGTYAVLTRRNAIAVLMGIELMLNAANINFLAFWRYQAPDSMEAQVFVLVGITIAAAEAAIGLAIMLNVYRRFATTDVDEISNLKG